MFSKKVLASFVFASALTAGSAFASTVNFDASNSSVSVNKVKSVNCGNCTLSIDLGSVNASTNNNGVMSDLVNWEGINSLINTNKAGRSVYKVVFDLAFSSQTGVDNAQLTTKFIFKTNTAGETVLQIKAGDYDTLSFSANDVMTVKLKGGGFDSVGSTNAKFDAVPAVVPLPAAGGLFLSALIGLGLVARRRKTKV